MYGFGSSACAFLFFFHRAASAVKEEPPSMELPDTVPPIPDWAKNSTVKEEPLSMDDDLEDSDEDDFTLIAGMDFTPYRCKYCHKALATADSLLRHEDVAFSCSF
jgi:hypothetical protein